MPQILPEIAPDKMKNTPLPRTKDFRRGEVVIAISLMLLMAVLSVGSIRRESLTYDEICHLSAGLAFWQEHDTRLSPEHPPLLRMIAAFPLVMQGIHPNYSSPSFCGAAPCEWWFAKEFLEQRDRNHLKEITFLARLPMMMLNLLLGGALYRIARRFWGSSAALLVLAVFCTSPFFISYGSLVITDVGLVLFVLLSGWMFACVLELQSAKNLAFFALTTAAALVSKFSAVLLFPALLVALFWWSWRRAKQNLPWRRAVCWACMGSGLSLILAFVFYAIFAARTWPPTLLADQIHSIPPTMRVRDLAVLQFDFMQKRPSLITLLRPLWLILIGAWRLIAQSEPTPYLLGSWRNGGTWYYFPAVTFFKTSPGTLLLWLAIPLLLLQHKFPQQRKYLAAREFQSHAMVLLSLFAVFAGSAIFSNINIGIRHFSVPIALLTLACGVVPWNLESYLNLGARRALLAVPVVICVFTALSTYPYYISYFNSFRGSIPKQEIAIDSNLDWGQSLLELEDFRANRRISTIWVNAFSQLNPAIYITGARPWVCGDGLPAAGQWLAVSANWITSAPPNCSYLLRYEHSAIGGGAMYVIHVH